MKKSKEVLNESGVSSGKANELKPVFEEALTSFHKVGRGANRRITQLLPNDEKGELDFAIYERIPSDDPLEGATNKLIETTDFTNYILTVAGIPKWGRSLALSGLSLLPAGVDTKASKDLYGIFKEEGYTSATVYYHDGAVKTIVRLVDGSTKEVDLFKTLDAFLEVSI